MMTMKKFKTSCTIEKVQGISKKTNKPYQAYVIKVDDIDGVVCFVDTYHNTGARLAALVDYLGEDVK